MTYTERDSAIRSAGSRKPSPGRENGAEPQSKLQPEVTLSDPWWWRLRDYFTPPELFTDRPAAIPELSAYAHRGDWCRSRYGALRSAGIWWWRLIGLPQTVRSRLREWIWQRPGRAVTVIVLVKVLSLTTPGAWVVERLIEPVVHAAIWLFL